MDEAGFEYEKLYILEIKVKSVISIVGTAKTMMAGAGCQEIKELVLNKKQKTEMLFKRPFAGQATSEIILIPEGNSTKVIWSMETEQETWMKIMRPMMDYQMGKSYEEGLNNLKSLIEK